MPDGFLLGLRGLGVGALAEIRSALADPSLVDFKTDLSWRPADTGGEKPGSAEDDFAARLRPELRARYRDFLRGLAALDLPADHRDRILNSLAAEPVPVNDLAVGDILGIAGADDLLDYYVATHELPKQPGWY